MIDVNINSKLMMDVLDVGAAMRPNSRWGFYSVPECYEFKEMYCPSFLQKYDER